MNALDGALGEKGTDSLLANVMSSIVDQNPVDAKLFEAAQRSGLDSETLYGHAQEVVDGFVQSAGSYMATKHGVNPDEIQTAIENQKLSKDILKDVMLSHVHTHDPRVWDKVVQEFMKKKGRGEL